MRYEHGGRILNGRGSDDTNSTEITTRRHWKNYRGRQRARSTAPMTRARIGST